VRAEGEKKKSVS